MGTVKAYPFSALVRQHLLLQARFAARYPNSWLIWEAGPWAPAAHEAALAQTALPSYAPNGPRKGDAFCYELSVAPGEQVRVGRAETNQVLINDATVSRNQLVIERRTEDLWWVAAVPQCAPVQVMGVPLTPEGTPLRPGTLLHRDLVALSFQSSEGLAAMVAAAAAKLL